ncbi:uncharacterized protein [Littorina saxatilis]|uniref:uncharacterized protein n=1 Tax=Littorina saxatilis TaxID=31220 RepID=UPI0038B67D1B
MASASKANLEEAFRNVGADVPKGMVHILHHVGSTRQDVYRSMWSSLIYVGKLSTSGKRTLVYPTRVAGADSPGPSSMGSTVSSKGFPATGFLSRDRGTFKSLPSTSSSHPTGVPVVGGNGNPFPAYASAQAVADGGGQDGLAFRACP